MKILKDKKILITGLYNNKSISFGIAKAMYKAGASLAFTYQKTKFKKKIRKIVKKFNSNIIIHCDVSSDINIINAFKKLNKFWPKFDGLVHSIAFAPKKQFQGNYIDVITKKDFLIAHDISSYSFVALIKFCKTMLNKNSSLLTISYLGSKKFISNYNVMGPAKASLEANIRYISFSMENKLKNIRVNAISVCPIKTLSSINIKNFNKILKYYKNCMKNTRSISINDIGNVATFLCSNLSYGINGEIINVDGGFNKIAINI